MYIEKYTQNTMQSTSYIFTLPFKNKLKTKHQLEKIA